jgi:3-methyladenine DNA glycosylase AlkC
MPEPLKNMYNEAFFSTLTSASEEVIPGFQTASFLHTVYDKEWENRELKERMRHVTLAFREQLPELYPDCLRIILELIPLLKNKREEVDILGFIFLPDFLEVFGKDHPEISVDAMEEITQFITCEFAIRPFILEHPDRLMKQMLAWTSHESEHVRRLASEGCRPRLPWAMGLPFLKKDPSPVLPIIEALKSDDSEYVRRSVANNLNNISKDHPELIINIASNWIGSSEETDKIVKHACRTLLKQGNQEVMRLFGFGSVEELSVYDLELRSDKVNDGEYLEFSFNLKNLSSEKQNVRLEYAIWFLKANGSHSKKVFKISEKEYEGNSDNRISRKQSFRPITTRTYYPGTHRVSVIVNGKEFAEREFTLLM